MSDLGSPVQSVSNSVPAPTQRASRPQAPFPLGQSSSTPAPLPLQAPAPTSASEVTDQNSPAPAPEAAPIAPAPQLEVSQQLAPAREAKTSLAPAPTAPAQSTVAPAALVRADNVAPAAPAAFKTEAVVAPAAVAKNRPVAAPTVQAARAVALAPRKVQRHRIPAPPWQNLLYFKELQEITAAIGQVKQRIGTAGGQFAWSRVGDEPPIPVSFEQLSDLTGEVFKGYSRNFDIEGHLVAAVAQLPATIAAELKKQIDALIADNAAEGEPATMQLEGLWIEFPLVIQNQAETDIASQSPDFGPNLEITVSILPSWSTNLGPFSVDRMYLKFGDIQRDLHPQSKNSASET